MDVMSPDRRQRRKKSASAPAPAVAHARPSADAVHEIVFFRRHPTDDPHRRTPGREALNAWPTKVRATARAALRAVAEAPPKRFAGGGYWEAMHGEMTGWFEVRVDGPGRRHYRLFCRLDYEAEGRHNPLLVVIDGRDKPFRTALTDSDYAQVRALGDEYFSRNPRSVV